MEFITEIASVVIKLVLFLLFVSLFIWLHCRPLITSYRLSPEGIDVMVLSVYKLHHINFRDITDIRVGGYMSELMFPNLRYLRHRKIVLDIFYPKQVVVITTTKNGKITYWILSTAPLDYIRRHTNNSVAT